MQRRTILKGIGAILAAPLAWLGRGEAAEPESRDPDTLVFDPDLKLRYVGPSNGIEVDWEVIRDRFAFQGSCNARPWFGIPKESCRYIGCSWVQGESAIATFVAEGPFMQWEDYDAVGRLTSTQKCRVYESTDFNTIFKPGEWEVCDA